MEIGEDDLLNAAVKVALDMVVKKFKTVDDIQKKRNISDVDLISVENRGNDNLPKQIRETFSEISLIIRSSILLLAKDLENQRIYAKDLDESDLSVLTQSELGRTLDYAESVEELAISHKTLSIVFKFVKKCNNTLLIRAKTAGLLADKKVHFRNVAMSGVLIYEMITIIIEHLDKFRLGGVDRLIEIYQQAAQHIAELEAKDTELENDYRQVFPDKHVELERQLSTIIDRREYRRKALEDWKKIVDEISVARQTTDSAIERLPKLRLLQRSAAIHVETAQISALVELVDQEFKDIEDLVDIEDFDLIPFSISNMKPLLGFAN